MKKVWLLNFVCLNILPNFATAFPHTIYTHIQFGRILGDTARSQTHNIPSRFSDRTCTFFVCWMNEWVNEWVQVLLRQHDLVRSLYMNGDMKSYILVCCCSFSHLVLGSVSVSWRNMDRIIVGGHYHGQFLVILYFLFSNFESWRKKLSIKNTYNGILLHDR